MTDLNPSKLGTKEYWDDFYKLEHENFSHDSNDTGECWFSDSGAEEKMVQFMQMLDDEGELDVDNTTVLDLGTGNGRLLFSLKEDFGGGKFLGIDYSQPAVEFAAEVAKNEQIENVEFRHADFLSNNDWKKSNDEKWDVVMDKGTLDAIALSGLKFGEQTAVEQYMKQVENLVGKLLLITSCNFTEQELIKAVEQNTKLRMYRKVDYPTFKFGGVEGQTICTVAFEI